MASPRPKLGAIDLNLLVVFDAIMQDRSVTRAGKRVGLSQPAMSHALIRLRHMLKDDLFVRSPKGMLPTPRAEQLALPVRAALDEFQHALAPAEFKPADATQTFSDHGGQRRGDPAGRHARRAGHQARATRDPRPAAERHA